MIKLTFTILISIICITSWAQDVAQWRGPNRDGIYNEPGLLKTWPDGGSKLVSHFDEMSDGHTSAAVNGL